MLNFKTMFHEYVKLLIDNSRRISDENLVFTGNVSKLSYGFPKEYKGLEVRTGFGMGNWANVTWIGFLAEGQSIQRGIYPVYLYYRDQDVLILAYGVSETNPPNIEWPVSNVQNIRNYAQQNGWTAKRYKGSFVYKAYTSEDIEKITDDFDEDLNNLINIYKEFMVNSTAETSDSDNPSQDKEQNPYMPLQTIYFGSPGTGKSFKIKDKILNGTDERFIFRTTFHPDTDYSSFVGCYKPICNSSQNKIRSDYTINDLADILKVNYESADIKTLALHSFALKYADYFNGSIAQFSKKEVIIKAGLSEDYKVEINKIVNLFGWMKENGYIPDKSLISYKFTPQTFTNAYIKAWLNPTQNVYLVIEEINRGNCAQIFGDIFQLLDRDDNGVSEYPVKADADLTKYLQDELGAGHEGIEEGKIKLPSNLYILATMNTSDQSLFPMDSAFKRRWEWKYVPTNITGDKKRILRVDSKEKTVMLNKEQEKKVLRLGMYEYDWSIFLEKINKCITDATHSDDKQLGFWFVKTPKDSNLINIDTFVSKVIFYLWNDIFKDFGAKATNPFAFKTAEGGMVVCPFSSFFDPYTGEVNLGAIHGFLYNLGIIPELEPEIQATIDRKIAEEGNPEA